MTVYWIWVFETSGPSFLYIICTYFCLLQTMLLYVRKSEYALKFSVSFDKIIYMVFLMTPLFFYHVELLSLLNFSFTVFGGYLNTMSQDLWFFFTIFVFLLFIDIKLALFYCISLIFFSFLFFMVEHDFTVEKMNIQTKITLFFFFSLLVLAKVLFAYICSHTEIHSSANLQMLTYMCYDVYLFNLPQEIPKEFLQNIKLICKIQKDYHKHLFTFIFVS